MNMSNTFRASIGSPEPAHQQGWWFVFSGYRLLVQRIEGKTTIPRAAPAEALGIVSGAPIHIGTFQELPCYAAEMTAAPELPADLSFEELRSLFARIEAGLYEAALTGVHLVKWDQNCRFCSRCGQAMRWRTDVRAKECAACGRLDFPRVSPAMIVLIEKGDELLLARSPRFPGAFFSVLAGFIEPGESLESAVHREVMEETGIAVKNIRYFGSQPWPFPDSLMVGFTAEYESGAITIDHEEIAEAGWYRIDNLPELPGKLSIARQLIDWFIARHLHTSGRKSDNDTTAIS